MAVVDEPLPFPLGVAQAVEVLAGMDALCAEMERLRSVVLDGLLDEVDPGALAEALGCSRAKVYRDARKHRSTRRRRTGRAG